MKLENVALGIQARMSSSRFPGKVLEPILGGTVLDLLLNNLQQLAIPLYVLTSNEQSDDVLVTHLRKRNVMYYRGSLEKVGNRYLDFCQRFSFDYVIRVSADSPLLHPDLVRRSLAKAQEVESFDLITNVFPRTFPEGQSVELLSKRMLERTSSGTSSIDLLEHVTRFAYENAEQFSIFNFRNESPYVLPKMSLDFPSEKEKITKMAKDAIAEGLFSLSWESFSSFFGQRSFEK